MPQSESAHSTEHTAHSTLQTACHTHAHVTRHGQGQGLTTVGWDEEGPTQENQLIRLRIRGSRGSGDGLRRGHQDNRTGSTTTQERMHHGNGRPAARGEAKGRKGVQPSPELGKDSHASTRHGWGGRLSVRCARLVELLATKLQGRQRGEADDIPDESVKARGRGDGPEMGAGDGGEEGAGGSPHEPRQVLTEADGEGAVPEVMETGAVRHGAAAGAARRRRTTGEL